MARPRVLFVAHTLSQHGDVGGVELYVDALRRRLRDSFEIFAYAFDGRHGNACVLYDEDMTAVERIEFDGVYDRMSLSNPAKERAFDGVLRSYGIELVHFHHLLGQPLALPVIARGRGVASIATWQDFWAVCDSYNLIDHRERYCDVSHRDPGICELCTLRRTGRPRDAQRVRRDAVLRTFAALDRAVFDSRSSRELFAGVFGDAVRSAKVEILALPLLEPVAAASSRVRPPRPAGAPLEVVAVGNFTVEKGADAFLTAAASLRDEAIAFTVTGRVQPRVAQRAARDPAPNVRFTGEYRPADLPATLRAADVACHLSIWPETYCMALSESWANGCIPIATSLGALGERITDGVNGFLVAADDAAELALVLRRIARDAAMLERMRANVDASLWMDEGEHAAVIAAWYRELLQPGSARERRARAARDAARCAADYGCGTTPRVATEIEHADADATRVVRSTSSASEALGDERGGEDVIELDFAVAAWEAQGALDEVCGAAPGREARSIAGDELTLSGWLEPLDRDDGPVWIVFDAIEDGARVLLPAKAVARPDVAAHLGDTGAVTSGFHASVAASRIGSGAFRVRLARLANGVLRATPPRAVVEIGAGLRVCVP